jgi:hypothetical protein
MAVKVEKREGVGIVLLKGGRCGDVLTEDFR